MKWKALTLTLCIVLMISTSGCARKPSNAATDPYEKFNRAVFAFNKRIDYLIYRPVAKVYKTILPSPVRQGVTNVFDNLGELTTMPNDLLQGKVKYVLVDFCRFLVNSTIGIAGLFDVATKLGLKRHHNDFGMTLAYWSKTVYSPYLQIPFLGPSTFRDGFSLSFDYIMSPYPYLRPTGYKYYPPLVDFINLRARLLPTDKLIANAFDPYIFVRNAYLQHRNAAVRANNQSKMVTLSSKSSPYHAKHSEPLPIEPPEEAHASTSAKERA